MIFDCVRGAERRDDVSRLSGMSCSANRRDQRLILGGKFLIEWIRKHGQAFDADELACTGAVYGAHFIHQAAMCAGRDGRGPDCIFLCGSRWDKLSHGRSLSAGR